MAKVLLPRAGAMQGRRAAAEPKSIAGVAIALFGTFATLTTLIYGVNQSSAEISTLATAAMAVVAITVFWIDRQRSFALLAFTLCYSLFLLGRQTLNLFTGTPDDERGVLGTGAPGPNDLAHTNAILFLGLAGLLTGWLVAGRTREVRNPVARPLDPAIRRAAAVLLVLTLPVELYNTWSTASAMGDVGFFEGRLSAAGAPLYIRALSALFHLSFFSYLAARPNRRGAILACAIYLFVGAFSLITLVRSDFILNTTVVMMYAYYRQVSLGEKWFTRGGIIGVLVGSPFVLALMNNLGAARGRVVGSSEGFLSPIFDFIRAQGVTIQVLVYSQEYSAWMPKDRWYSFGPFIESAQRISALVTGGTPPALQGQTADRALNGHQLSHTISYLIAPVDYVRGVGYGSTYVAELLLDFGIAGVILGSIVYGLLLVRASSALNGRFIPTVITLMLLKGALFVPRASFVQPLVDPFALPSLIAIPILAATVLLVAHTRLGNPLRHPRNSTEDTNLSA
ncbi:hypothetical protein GCM10027599_25890 [Yimella radicis]